MNNTILTKTKGSIALISILIISAILIIFTVGMSESNISTMYEYLNNESTQNMYHAAEACLEESILRIEENTNFTGTTMQFNDITCTSKVSGAETKTVLITVTYLQYTQNYSAQLSVTTSGQANNASLSSWEKI